jgi:hypothetical protein
MDTIVANFPTVALRMTEAELCGWLGAAAPGDVVEYHRGFLAIDVSPNARHLIERERKELVRLARRALWAAEEGWAHLVQRRHGPGDHSYLLIARPRPKTDRRPALALLAPEAA